MFNALLHTFPFADLFRLTPGVHLHISAFRTRWYNHVFRIPKATTPPAKEEMFLNDWEHNLYQPRSPDAIRSSIQELPGFKSLDERVKSLFTYQFVPKRKEFEEQLTAKLAELGYHPTDTSVGAKVVRMTMLLRYKKWTLKGEHRNRKLICAIKALIVARQSELRHLRATNLPEFNRLVEALQITGYRHPDPYELPNTDVVSQRKKAFREECYQSRLARLALLKSELSASAQSFYEQKAAKLNSLLHTLASLDSKDTSSNVEPNSEQMEKAKDILKALFQEVVQERRSEVLRAPEEDELKWFSREAVLRKEYFAKQAEKAERQSRRKR